MDWWQAIILALLQGLTEFLPISSSAHLVIPSLMLGWKDQGLAFDVAVHVGTLSAVVIYFRRDLIALLLALVSGTRERRVNDGCRQVMFLVVATLPVVITGFLLNDVIEGHLRTLPVIAATTLVFGLVLGLADRSARDGIQRDLTLPIALAVGIAQAIAPVPGVSRSGVTITAGLLLGLGHQRAARFSFLLSIPVIAGAGLLKGRDLLLLETPVPWLQLLLAALLAGTTAYACIAAFLRLIDRIGLMPFVYYRVALALVLAALWLA
ncbi:undecaprenyl-diphosphate phosphatase [Chromatocurvus halotolerans]|uniref:undecaprenyl-diphosphate phosphatase n=1 Tax=Chromatocurvus halotolerans TaxID=1132028 RepID=UPI000E3D63CE|nr:undecaprenyl-diphosphate phosphatase [Chromatocurvus halotolerans]